MLPKDSGGNMYTAQVHEVTAKLEQQVSSLTAALEDSKQREGLTAHKLSHALQTELKQVHSLPSTLPSTHQSMYSSICVVTQVHLAHVSRCCVTSLFKFSASLFKFSEPMSISALTLHAAGLTGRRCTTWCAEFSVTVLCVCHCQAT